MLVVLPFAGGKLPKGDEAKAILLCPTSVKQQKTSDYEY
jgi:hypothetical protein